MGNICPMHFWMRYSKWVGPNVVRYVTRGNKASSSKELHQWQQQQGIERCEGG